MFANDYSFLFANKRILFTSVELNLTNRNIVFISYISTPESLNDVNEVFDVAISGF